MHFPVDKRSPTRPIHQWVPLFTAALLMVAGCTIPYKAQTFGPPVVSVKEQEEIDKAIISLRKYDPYNVAASRRTKSVYISAKNIQLPATGPSWDLQEYSLYVWANHPGHPNLGIRELTKTELLHFAVLGARVDKIRFRSSSESDIPNDIKVLATQTYSDLSKANQDVLEIVVLAGDIKEPLNITAWYPTEFRESAKSDETDPTKATSPIEDNAWYAHQTVGVKSGDLTTNIQIVDQAEARASFGEEFSRRYFVGRVYLRNANADNKLIVYTTSMRVPVISFRQSQNAAAVVKRAESWKAIRGARKNEGMTKPSLSDGFRESLDAFAVATDEERKNPPNPRTAVWTFLNDYRTRQSQALDVMNTKVTAFQPTLESNESVKKNLETAGDAKTALQPKWKDLLEADDAHLNATELLYEKQVNVSIPEARRPEFITLGRDFVEERRLQLQVRVEQDEFSRHTLFSPSLRAKLQATAAGGGLLAAASNNGPFDERGIRVGLTGNILAESTNPQQAALDAAGHPYRDVFRPMTFQAVLNSLMLAYDESQHTSWYNAASAVSRVMGGLITLGPIFNEVERQGYARLTAFTSSVIVPELGHILLEDLNKHIRNLSDMSMDTVMVLDPRASVDRYVFFPRGPIFNNPDEFDQRSPSYIVKVLGDEVFVEAELVSKNTPINGLNKPASELAAAALDEGRASLASEAAHLNEVRNQAMSSELALVLGKIEKVLRAFAEETDVAKKKTLLQQAQQYVRDFRATYKDAGNKAFNDLFQGYGQKADDLPPTMEALPTLHLIVKSASAAGAFPVKDDFTTPGDLLIKGTASGTGVTWTATAAADGKSVTYVVDASDAVIATTTSNPPITPPSEERSVTISIKDRAENETGSSQTIELLNPEMTVAVNGKDVSKAPADSAPIPFSETATSSLVVTLDVKDSTTDGWTLVCTSKDSTDITFTPKTVPLTVKAGKVLTGTVAIDGSKLGDEPKNIHLQLLWKDKPVGEAKDYTAKKEKK